MAETGRRVERTFRFTSRSGRRLPQLATAVLLGIATASLIVTLRAADAWNSWFVDARVWIALGHRWLETGSLYAPYQLTGPYPVLVTADISQTPGLYPPAAGPVFGLLSVLPTPLMALWWLVPIGILALLLTRWRPASWTWPLMAACLAWPGTFWQFVVGGTAMWTAALVAVAFVRPAVAALVLLKPTFAPFGLIGIRNGAWWVVAVALAVLNFAGAWRDYPVAIINGGDPGWLAHSLGQFPLVLIPVFAWIGRRRIVGPTLEPAG